MQSPKFTTIFLFFHELAGIGRFGRKVTCSLLIYTAPIFVSDESEHWFVIVSEPVSICAAVNGTALTRPVILCFCIGLLLAV